MHPNRFASFVRNSRKVSGQYNAGKSLTLPLKVKQKMSKAAPASKKSNLNCPPKSKNDWTGSKKSLSVKQSGKEYRTQNKPMNIRKVNTNTGK